MHEMAGFFNDCLRSGTLLGSLCAALVVPPVVWLLCRFLLPYIRGMKDDPMWQAPLAAAAASLPGATLVIITSQAIVGALGTACLTNPIGRLILGLFAASLAVCIIRGITCSIGRAREVRSLIARSRQASARLASVAEACGLSARELDEAMPVCALARSAPPVVLVSKGALKALTDEELSAVLLHERAHARRGDQLITACMLFLTDVLPLPSAEFIATYRCARELAADQYALRSSPVEHLAGALVTFSKSARSAAMAACFAEAGAGVVLRLKAMLGEAPPRTHPTRARTRILIAATMLALFVAAVATPTLAATSRHACPMHSVRLAK